MDFPLAIMSALKIKLHELFRDLSSNKNRKEMVPPEYTALINGKFCPAQMRLRTLERDHTAGQLETSHNRQPILANLDFWPNLFHHKSAPPFQMC
jgi:hypothetical protein